MECLHQSSYRIAHLNSLYLKFLWNVSPVSQVCDFQYVDLFHGLVVLQFFGVFKECDDKNFNIFLLQYKSDLYRNSKVVT